MSKSYQNSSNSGSENYYTPDTPNSQSWQQYRCRSCDLPKRVAIKPTEAPHTLRTGCERCESKTAHRADGGSGRLNMIDLTKNPDFTPAAVVGGLQAGRIVRTSVRDDGDHVHLVGGDEVCSGCDELISVDDFGEHAPFFNILANQMKRHGETYCRECHKEATSDD